jgi:hypothetical protein
LKRSPQQAGFFFSSREQNVLMFGRASETAVCRHHYRFKRPAPGNFFARLTAFPGNHVATVSLTGAHAWQKKN